MLKNTHFHTPKRINNKVTQKPANASCWNPISLQFPLAVYDTQLCHIIFTHCAVLPRHSTPCHSILLHISIIILWHCTSVSWTTRTPSSHPQLPSTSWHTKPTDSSSSISSKDNYFNRLCTFWPRIRSSQAGRDEDEDEKHNGRQLILKIRATTLLKS